jgi:ABC-2 type transport system permease protein
MSNILKQQPLLIQLADLLLIQLSNWRWSWRGMLLTGTIAPLVSVAALGTFATDAGGKAFDYILVGSLVLSIMFEIHSRVCNNFAFMKAVGMFGYFATLPIQRALLILATALAFLVISLPSLIIVSMVGSWILHLPLRIHPLVIVAVPLAAAPLSGIGALIGSKARTMEEANLFAMLVNYASLGLGPVMFPPERLPGFLVHLGWLSPASYAASALRQTLLGPLTPRLGLDLFVLALLSVIIFRLVERTIDWRAQG